MRSTERGCTAPPGSTAGPKLPLGVRVAAEGPAALLRRQRGALGGPGAAGLSPVQGAEAGPALQEQLVAHARGQSRQAVHPHYARLPPRHQPALRVQVGAEAHLRGEKGVGGRGLWCRDPAPRSAWTAGTQAHATLTLCRDSSCRRSRLSSAIPSCWCILRMGSRLGRFLKLRCGAAAPPWLRARGRSAARTAALAAPAPWHWHHGAGGCCSPGGHVSPSGSPMAKGSRARPWAVRLQRGRAQPAPSGPKQLGPSLGTPLLGPWAQPGLAQGELRPPSSIPQL